MRNCKDNGDTKQCFLQHTNVGEMEAINIFSVTIS